MLKATTLKCSEQVPPEINLDLSLNSTIQKCNLGQSRIFPKSLMKFIVFEHPLGAIRNKREFEDILRL